jgi:hypothetical protein
MLEEVDYKYGEKDWDWVLEILKTLLNNSDVTLEKQLKYDFHYFCYQEEELEKLKE